MRHQILFLLVMSFVAAGCETAAKKRLTELNWSGRRSGCGGRNRHQTGDRAKGAAIGAAIGGVAGSGIGYRMDKQAKELEKVAETKRTENGIVSKLKSDILFDSGQAVLKPQAITNLAQMAAIPQKIS